jgi:hypothetical protein
VQVVDESTLERKRSSHPDDRLQRTVQSDATRWRLERYDDRCRFPDYFMLPKRRFWKAEQKMTSGFSIDFSMVRSPNRVLTPLKSVSKIRISSFVQPSKIFVWEGYISEQSRWVDTPSVIACDHTVHKTLAFVDAKTRRRYLERSNCAKIS